MCLKYGLGIRLIQSALGACSTPKVRVTVLEISVPPTQGFHLQEREKPHLLQEAAQVPDCSGLHNPG